MASKAELYIKRAKTELESAEILFDASSKKEIKQNFRIEEDATYYSGVIAHSYYCIFYCAKAMLLSKNIETESPEVHRKTFDRFEEIFIRTNLLDVALLKIYSEMIIRAETLLEIYWNEKRKRGDFTYNTIPQANKEPAEESVRNSKEFFRHCRMYLSF